jgi:hypothetical protein
MEKGFATGARSRADALFPSGVAPEKSDVIYRQTLLKMVDFNVYRACEKLADEPPRDGIRWVEPKTENLDEAAEYLERALCLLNLYGVGE